MIQKDWPVKWLKRSRLEKYLGMQQNLVEAVNDKLGIVDPGE
jgi:hypothetical protein